MKISNAFLSLLAAGVLCLLGARDAVAEFDAFLKISGAPGESQDAGHPGENIVQSFHQGTESPPDGGLPTLTFSVVKHLDTASPTLNFWAAGGEVIEGVTLTLRQVGGNQVEFLTIELEGAKLSSVTLTGEASGPDEKPAERLTFTFDRITWTYTPILPGGGAGTPTTRYWDNQTGTGG